MTTTSMRTPQNKLEGLMNKAIAVHVRYKSSYISFLSKITTSNDQFLRIWKTQTTAANFLYFNFELNALHI